MTVGHRRALDGHVLVPFVGGGKLRQVSQAPSAALAISAAGYIARQHEMRVP